MTSIRFRLSLNTGGYGGADCRHLSPLRPEVEFKPLCPSPCVFLLRDNLVTSLPVTLVDGSLTSLTLAGNPLTCDCAQLWLSHANVVRLSTIVADCLSEIDDIGSSCSRLELPNLRATLFVTPRSFRIATVARRCRANRRVV